LKAAYGELTNTPAPGLFHLCPSYSYINVSRLVVEVSFKSQPLAESANWGDLPQQQKPAVTKDLDGAWSDSVTLDQ
jgi:hypothetical protein